MSDKDFSGRLLVPVIARARRPLSNKASTDSCNILFSLRIMMSGACSSINLFKRLLRLITRRYKSFKSEVAKRPPSNGTKGRNSGGITGNTSKIIHSGLVLDSRKASIILRRLTNFLRLASELFSLSSSRIALRSASKSIEAKISFKASAPIPALKESSPYSSIASWYCSSLNSSLTDSGVKPGSITI